MLPFNVTQYIQRLDAVLPALRAEAMTCPMNFQHVYSSYLVVRAAGLVEFAVTEILAAYAAQHHSPEVQNFVRRALSYENSLNCQKIEKIFGRFSGLWWPGIRGMTSEEQRAAVDSLKTLRDQFAHGQTNGTGYAIVETYYARAKEFVRNMSDFLLA